MTDMTDLVAMLRKVDATHAPAEANDLMSEAARIIDDLERHNRELRETVSALLAPTGVKHSDGFGTNLDIRPINH